MQKIAVFPGSFDPYTRGHHDIVQRALPLFDRVIVAIGINNEKRGMFPVEQRVAWIEALYKDENRVETCTYEGLTVDFCRERGARFIIRGVRNTIDFEYEKTIAQMNSSIGKGIETVLLFSNPLLAQVSSTVIRDLVKNGYDVSEFIPYDITSIIP